MKISFTNEGKIPTFLEKQLRELISSKTVQEVHSGLKAKKMTPDKILNGQKMKTLRKDKYLQKHKISFYYNCVCSVWFLISLQKLWTAKRKTVM